MSFLFSWQSSRLLLLLCSALCFFSIEAKEPVPQHERFYQKARTFHEAKDYPRAIEWYQLSLKSNKDYPDALRGLGLAYYDYSLALMKQSAMFFEEALILDPNHEQALEENGKLMVNLGRLKEAKEFLKKLEGLRSINALPLKESLDSMTQSAILVLQE